MNVCRVGVVLIACLAARGWAAEVCPPGGQSLSGGPAAVLQWRSSRGDLPGNKFCIANEIRAAADPVTVAWPEAGISKAATGGLRVAQCCFDGVKRGPATIEYGTPGGRIELSMYKPAEEGLASHEEGFPDLIEEDARVRVVSIRGTLLAGGQPLRVDVQLKCSASQFAKQHAYQYAITDRSQDTVVVDWDLVTSMSALVKPSVQTAGNTKTYVFIHDKAPREVEGVVSIRSRTGELAGIFRLDGFAMNH